MFAWQDEWFKRTWNIMDLELPPDRRQLWQNPLTNESHFGLVAMDPGAGGSRVVVDGDNRDWTSESSQAILESNRAVREVRASHDESYLYLGLILDEARAWDDTTVTVGLDTVPGGNGGLPGVSGVGAAADTAVVVGPGQQANAYVRASNDYNDLVLGQRLGFYEVAAADLVEGSGVWNLQRLVVNHPLLVPVLGLEQPIEWFELSPLVTGSSAPGEPGFDSRTVWAAAGAVVEMRVPWAMVGMSDPSSRSALVVSDNGEVSTAQVERLGITVTVGPSGEETAGYAWSRGTPSNGGSVPRRGWMRSSMPSATFRSAEPALVAGLGGASRRWATATRPRH